MTKNNSFKKQIRARMKMTGETYAQAREALYRKTFTLEFLLTNGLSPAVNKPNPQVMIEDLFSGQELQDLQTGLSKRNNILVCGGAYTGKTFTLNAILNSNAAMNPGLRVITVEENMNELVVSGDLNVSLIAQPRVSSIRYLVQSALRMRPDAIAVGEIQTDEIWMMDQLAMTGTISFTTCHARSITQIAGYMGADDFSQATTVVMVDRLRIGEHVLFLNTVIPITDEVRKAMEIYRRGHDERTLHATLDSLGVVTIDSKRRKLADLGIIK